ncbi:STAS/SEC14 domain-containing protein [Marivita sp. GX14005]|uniref:STAS/SEC14 domain-containing protein n=1 Tax=Marivita sp. GX14005 TaxID=2942276 RepID=UPI002019FA1B|nr:STAS/SEC14 domain-containing protein [Marivita sp. GX14005]MCL3882557.1 STAS/SEC14 domain-containing protein [Marivita sp. GX14005]
MLTVQKLKPQVFEVTLQGIVTKDDIDTMKRELTPVLESEGPIGLVIRAEDWADATADAIAEDMKFEFGQLPQWAKIAKLAMVTDLQAFSALLKWIDPVLPMIDMRSFASTEIEAARAFASDLPGTSPDASGRGIRLLADGSDGVVAFEVDGRITKSDVDAVFAPLQGVLQSDRKVNLLAVFRNWDGFDPALFMDSGLMSNKFGMIGHMERYAIVGAPGWMRSLVQTMAPMMPFEMRFFDAESEAEAHTWVGWT